MKITSDKILFFDLDGTLVDTDYANWIAYEYAWKYITETKKRIHFNPRFIGKDGRVYFGYSAGYFNHLMSFGKSRTDKNSFEDEDIVVCKQKIETKYIQYSKKMEENVALLKRFYRTNKIILVSNAKKSRGLETLKYHQLDSYFHKIFFKEDKTFSENKYENAIKTLGINPQNIIAFEDNETEIQKAKEAGVQHINIKVEGKNIKEIFGGVFKHSTNKILIYQNDDKKIRIEFDNNILRDILENKDNYKLYVEEEQYSFPKKEGKSNQEKGKRYKILKDGIKEFTIEPNSFLKQEIKALYHKDYFGGGNWDIEGKIEHLIWSLKNDEGCESSHTLYLSTACKRLKNILLQDLPEIKGRIMKDELTVCVVPRAKEGFIYRKDQLLFRQIVSDVVDQMEGFVNGTKYIVRHTSTQTTHLKDEGISPYPGITKDTCYISDNVIGKNILLIDDVYTKGVGIDEDAIQALLDKGAYNVWFYSIGKTYSYK